MQCQCLLCLSFLFCAAITCILLFLIYCYLLFIIFLLFLFSLLVDHLFVFLFLFGCFSSCCSWIFLRCKSVHFIDLIFVPTTVLLIVSIELVTFQSIFFATNLCPSLFLFLLTLLFLSYWVNFIPSLLYIPISISFTLPTPNTHTHTHTHTSCIFTCGTFFSFSVSFSIPFQNLF